MGCDVHTHLEKRVQGVWQPAKEPVKNEDFDPDSEDTWYTEFELPCSGNLTGGRYYSAFGLLSGVRHTLEGYQVIPDDCGIPEDVSEPVKADYERWDSDAHTPGYVLWSELIAMQERIKIDTLLAKVESGWLEVINDLVDGFKSCCDEANIHVLEGRIVLWYDN